MKILLINICKEKLHYFEFVKPIEDILKENKISYFVREYKRVNSQDLKDCDKVIICGTSLKDNEFSLRDNIKFWKWISDFDKPLLGICGGMQVVGLAFGGRIKKETEIGFFSEQFNDNFLGLSGKQEVWHLHNNYVDFTKLKDFEVVCSGNGISQSARHKEKDIYGVLFHPEVRNKKLIREFTKL